MADEILNIVVEETGTDQVVGKVDALGNSFQKAADEREKLAKESAKPLASADADKAIAQQNALAAATRKAKEAQALSQLSIARTAPVVAPGIPQAQLSQLAALAASEKATAVETAKGVALENQRTAALERSRKAAAALAQVSVARAASASTAAANPARDEQITRLADLAAATKATATDAKGLNDALAPPASTVNAVATLTAEEKSRASAVKALAQAARELDAVQNASAKPLGNRGIFSTTDAENALRETKLLAAEQQRLADIEQRRVAAAAAADQAAARRGRGGRGGGPPTPPGGGDDEFGRAGRGADNASRSVDRLGASIGRLVGTAIGSLVTAIGINLVNAFAKLSDRIAQSQKDLVRFGNIKLDGEGFTGQLKKVGDQARLTQDALNQTALQFRKFSDIRPPQITQFLDTLTKGIQAGGGGADATLKVFQDLSADVEKGTVSLRTFKDLAAASEPLAQALAASFGSSFRGLQDKIESGSVSVSELVRRLRTVSGGIGNEFSQTEANVEQSTDKISQAITNLSLTIVDKLDLKDKYRSFADDFSSFIDRLISDKERLDTSFTGKQVSQIVGGSIGALGGAAVGGKIGAGIGGALGGPVGAGVGGLGGVVVGGAVGAIAGTKAGGAIADGASALFQEREFKVGNAGPVPVTVQNVNQFTARQSTTDARDILGPKFGTGAGPQEVVVQSITGQAATVLRPSSANDNAPVVQAINQGNASLVAGYAAQADRIVTGFDAQGQFVGIGLRDLSVGVNQGVERITSNEKGIIDDLSGKIAVSSRDGANIIAISGREDANLICQNIGDLESALTEQFEQFSRNAETLLGKQSGGQQYSGTSINPGLIAEQIAGQVRSGQISTYEGAGQAQGFGQFGGIITQAVQEQEKLQAAAALAAQQSSSSLLDSSGLLAQAAGSLSDSSDKVISAYGAPSYYTRGAAPTDTQKASASGRGTFGENANKPADKPAEQKVVYVSVPVTITTPNADSFGQSSGQAQADIAFAVLNAVRAA